MDDRQLSPLRPGFGVRCLRREYLGQDDDGLSRLRGGCGAFDRSGALVAQIGMFGVGPLPALNLCLADHSPRQVPQNVRVTCSSLPGARAKRDVASVSGA